jgi:hypothetical protein
MKQTSKRSVKKPYQPPKLHVYGNLAEMTKAGGPHSKKDMGTVRGSRHTGA